MTEEQNKQTEEQKAEAPQEESEEQAQKKTTKKTESAKEQDSEKQESTESSTKKQASNQESSEEKNSEDKSTKKKQESKKEEKPKKDYAIANGVELPISTKYAVAICKFIRGLPIEEAIKKMEEVEQKKIAVPMKGEYAHKKHAKKYASGSGKYPQKASINFVKLLKNLSGNALSNGLEKPIVSEASANVGSRPMARFGMWKRKRTNVKLIAREKPQKTKKKVKQAAK